MYVYQTSATLTFTFDIMIIAIMMALEMIKYTCIIYTQWRVRLIAWWLKLLEYIWIYENFSVDTIYIKLCMCVCGGVRVCVMCVCVGGCALCVCVCVCVHIHTYIIDQTYTYAFCGARGWPRTVVHDPLNSNKHGGKWMLGISSFCASRLSSRDSMRDGAAAGCCATPSQ